MEIDLININEPTGLSIGRPVGRSREIAAERARLRDHYRIPTVAL